jgi:hypothetical protein
MQPNQLKPEQFAEYPPQARALVIAHLPTIRQLPLSFVPSMLREVIDYDYKFPAERASISAEFAALGALSPSQLLEWFEPFSGISLSSKLESFDWINQPAQFVESQSAYLWSTHQLDAFRRAATGYGDRLASANPPQAAPAPRVGVAIVGQGVDAWEQPLFRKLREHGTCFNHIQPQNGVQALLHAAAARARAHPVPYGHWYVDGGQEEDHSPMLTCVSYQRLEPVRAALLRNIDAEIARPGMGPEELRTHLARLKPADAGMTPGGDAVMDRFQLKLFTEGSGTQIFSTTFAQWTTREALRRAQPLTLVVRFAPRQRQKAMNELLSSEASAADLDAAGSLVDADMAAYYHWINQQRLPGAEKSSFIAWFEGHSQAVAVSPYLPRGTTSSSPLDLGQLFALAAG